MDGRKTCKECRTVVVNPVECNSCDIASHPSCLSRTGHPHSNGKFVNCNQSSNNHLLKTIQDLIRSEFSKFRTEMLETYRADLEKITSEIQQLSDRVDGIQNVTTNLPPHVPPSASEEDIIAELADRENRSCNLIFYLDEPSKNQANALNDNDLVNDIKINHFSQSC